jgi:tRNA threonylcarbamoyladenosine biosynthesis protein TsaE
MEMLSKSDNKTKEIGQRLGRNIVKSLKNKDNFVIGLIGDLGGGKTIFIKGVAKGLGIKDSITSPTFTLLKEYKAKGIDLYHFDFYRLKNLTDAKDLGLLEYLEKPKSVSLIEWADRLKDILPKEKIIIEFDFLDDNTRRLIFKPFGKKYTDLVKKLNFSLYT